MSLAAIALWVIVGLIVIAVIAGVVGHLLVKRGRREPLVVRAINQASDRVIDTVKEPITVAVLDQVAEVLAAGAYTQNIAASLRENHDQLTAMISEKIKEDQATRYVRLVPFHDRLLREASETTLRVVLEVLADPRTDELVRDLVRNNLGQLRQAIRDRRQERLATPEREPM